MYSKTLKALFSTTNIRLLLIYTETMSSSYLRFFNNVLVCIMVDRSHLPPGYYCKHHSVQPLFPFAFYAPVMPNCKQFSLTCCFLCLEALPTLSIRKLLCVWTLFSSFLQNGHLINIPWLFNALSLTGWSFDKSNQLFH